LTLAVSSVLLGVITTFGQLGGTYGLIGTPSAQIGGARLSTPTAWFLPLLLIMALSYAICWRFGESAYGRVLRVYVRTATLPSR
jgi:branched-chain amino acid transport system permease protein